MQRLPFPVPFGNRGCNGGDVYSALNYIIDNGGVDTENSYGFKEKVYIPASKHVLSVERV